MFSKILNLNLKVNDVVTSSTFPNILKGCNVRSVYRKRIWKNEVQRTII